MCRWMAYRGQPLLIDELLYKTRHSLIEQSRHARMGVETFNGDGFVRRTLLPYRKRSLMG